MIVGVPKEVKDDEYRVAITPAGVRELTSAGHTVYVEKGAGVGSSMPDADFMATGAKIVDDPDDIWAEADLVLGVKEPVAEEYPRLGLTPGPGPVHLPPPGRLAAVHRGPDGRRATRPSPTRRCAWPTTPSPCSRPMSEVAGRMAPLMGAHHLMRPGGGRGVLVCGVPGVRCAKVVILGAGVAGMAAATLAVGMHSEVYILDRNLERLRQVDHHFRGALETVASSTHAIEECCVDADIVIGAVLVVGAKAPKLVSDDLVARMRDGSVLVDISVDQGGCFESTRPTTHSDPTFEVNGSLFYCVANMPGAVPHSSTHALVNATLPYVLDIANHGWRDAVPARRRPGRGGQRGRGFGGLRAGGRGPRHDHRFRWPPSSTDRPCRRCQPGPCRRCQPGPCRRCQPAPCRRCQPAPCRRCQPASRWRSGTDPVPVAPGQMVGDDDAGPEGGIGHRVEADRAQGDLAGPHVEPGVGAVAVVGRTAG